MTVITSKTKVEFSTKEFQTLEDARILLADILDLLNDDENTLVTDKIKWRYSEIDNAIILLDALAHDEVTIVESQD